MPKPIIGLVADYSEANEENNDQMFSVGASMTLGTGESTTASNMIPGEFCSTKNVEIDYFIKNMNF